MHGDLISIPTPTHPLDGIFYEPRDRPVHGAVQIFHGNAMNFYVGPPRFLAQPLVEAGYACLAYNRRGHDTLSTRRSREPEGNAFQTAQQAIEDNRLARAWLASRGYERPVVIGHSNGGMLAVRHVASFPDTPALVLLSAHRGGRSLVELASGHGLLARDELGSVVSRARRMVADGQGDELMLLPGWWHVCTAASFLDVLENTPDIIELAPAIRCPSLYLRGDAEPADLYPMEEFSSRSAGPCTTMVIGGCDHFYNGCEEITAQHVIRWLDEVLPGRQRSPRRRPPGG